MFKYLYKTYRKYFRLRLRIYECTVAFTCFVYEGEHTEIHLQPNKRRKNKILHSGLVS